MIYALKRVMLVEKNDNDKQNNVSISCQLCSIWYDNQKIHPINRLYLYDTINMRK